MPDTLSIADLLTILVPTLIGAAIGLLGPILYSRLARRHQEARRPPQ
jgi:hypothetical protein